MIKVIQLNDTHIPFHDEKTLSAIYKFADYFNPDEIVIAGDFIDCYELSRFDKNPDRQFRLQDELDIATKILRKLSRLCGVVKFIEGNHEARLRKYLWKNPELASLKALELPRLLEIDKIKGEYYDFEYILNEFRFAHGEVVRAHSSYSAKAAHERYGSNMSMGHTHRLGSYYKTDARGTTAAFENGCTCLLSPEYVAGIPNWQQSISAFFFEDNRYFCQQIPIIDNQFIYDGRRFK